MNTTVHKKQTRRSRIRLTMAGGALILLIATALSCIYIMFAKYTVSYDNYKFNLDVNARYKVTFDPKGGTIISGPESKIVEIGGKYGELPAVEREGYSFDSWVLGSFKPGYTAVDYLESTGEKQYIDTGIIPNNTTGADIRFSTSSKDNGSEIFGGGGGWQNNSYELYAWDYQWQENYANQYQFRLDVAGYGSGTNPIFHYVSDRSNPSKADITNEYNGAKAQFSFSNTVFTSASTISLFALHRSPISYASNHIRIYSFKLFKNGEDLLDMIPAVWSGGNTTYSINGQLKKNAYLEMNTAGMYDILHDVFYVNSGGGTFETGPVSKHSGTIIDSDTEVTLTEDHTVWAEWKANQYQVKLNIEDDGSSEIEGLVKDTITVTYDDTFAELPDLRRAGYDFIGWEDESGKRYSKTDIVKITENIELHAVWDPKEYTVSFDLNGGTGETAPKTVIFDENYGELSTPSRAEYEFLGWRSTNLPVGYRELTYLESSGTQYLDTGVIGDQTTVIKTRFSSSTTNDDSVIFGGAQEYNSKALELYIYKLNWELNRSSSYLYLDTIRAVAYDEEHENIFSFEGNLENPSQTTITNETTGESKTFTQTGDFTTPYTIDLFASHRPKMYISAHNVRIYEFKLYKNGELLRDLVPAVWDGNGEITYSKDGSAVTGTLAKGTAGMLDKKNDVFYINCGTGQFIRGPEKGKGTEDYITSETRMTIPNDHTLYANWEMLPSDKLTLVRQYGKSDEKVQVVMPEKQQ